MLQSLVHRNLPQRAMPSPTLKPVGLLPPAPHRGLVLVKELLDERLKNANGPLAHTAITPNWLHLWPLLGLW